MADRKGETAFVAFPPLNEVLKEALGVVLFFYKIFFAKVATGGVWGHSSVGVSTSGPCRHRNSGIYFNRRRKSCVFIN
jgi:hypothetical protein